MRLLVIALLGVLGVALVLAIGAASFSGARERGDATILLDGVAHDCWIHREVWVSGGVVGPGDARVFVDGTEVGTDVGGEVGFERVPGTGAAPAGTVALVPAPLDTLHCDDGATHRLEIRTATPEGCRWSFSPAVSQTDARGHQGLPAVTVRRCAVTVVD